MRLFTALWPTAEAVSALRADTDPEHPPPGWRAVDPADWHLTLAFHGEADPGVLARRLDAAARGAPAPLLRITGAGVFHEVRWAGVAPEPSGTGDEAARLRRLVELAGGHPDRFVGHVTVLRRRRRPGPGADRDPGMPWARHDGPSWRPLDVLLVSSEPARVGSRYRVVHRVPLGG